MKFGMTSKPSGLYEVRFSRRADVPAFAAAARESAVIREENNLDPHRFSAIWSRVGSNNVNTLLGSIYGMEETAQMLGAFAMRTDQSMNEILQRHAPHQDPMTVRIERYDVGGRCDTLARGIRQGLARHVIVDPNMLAEEFEFYLDLRPVGEEPK